MFLISVYRSILVPLCGHAALHSISPYFNSSEKMAEIRLTSHGNFGRPRSGHSILDRLFKQIDRNNAGVGILQIEEYCKVTFLGPFDSIGIVLDLLMYHLQPNIISKRMPDLAHM